MIRSICYLRITKEIFRTTEIFNKTIQGVYTDTYVIWNFRPEKNKSQNIIKGRTSGLAKPFGGLGGVVSPLSENL